MTAGMVEITRIMPSLEDGDFSSGSHWVRLSTTARPKTGSFSRCWATGILAEPAKTKPTTSLMAMISAPFISAQRMPKTRPRISRP